MKYLRFLIPLVFLFFACTEEVIKYLKEPVYIDKIVVKTDTVIIEKEVVQTIYDTLIQYDTIIETDTITIYQIDTVEVIVEVTDTVYVDRETTITYPPELEPYVNFVFDNMEESEALAIDVVIEITDDPFHARYVTNTVDVKQGGLSIVIVPFVCPEGTVIRELMHYVFLEPYWGEWDFYETPDEGGVSNRYTDHIMSKNWPKCLEAMDEETRLKYLREVFPNL